MIDYYCISDFNSNRGCILEIPPMLYGYDKQALSFVSFLVKLNIIHAKVLNHMYPASSGHYVP